MDFKLNIEHDGNINILQITDMQIIDATQRRTADRLGNDETEQWDPEKKEQNIYSHIKYLIDKSNPDLIIITGDIIYGEFDDSGEVFKEFTDFMDSFKIPWAPIFGNHDNESKKGVDWQCAQFENAKYALFKRGNVFGNGNYTIGIYQNDTLKRAVFMTDSNGCAGIGISAGYRDDQLKWIENEADKIHETNPDTPLFICNHIPTKDFTDAYIAAGYQTEPDISWKNGSIYELGKDVPAADGDFGKKGEGLRGIDMVLMPLLKKCGFDGFFTGHYHLINTSVMYDGIRFTFGYKTGYYDYYDTDANGGTLITLKDKEFFVKHLQYVE